ncbi:MAG TPA: hypothetical protein EYP08_06870 [Pyrodictiaceae archaeon]|nr:hypothetical protein [Pyrodictiaceae archaeon]HIP85019.1 hypothetical protein [Pyrodictium sp.]HIQ55604.1 hypothetical protein [Pyrodictium sp.]
MGKKMRLTLPKREEDIEKIVNEVMERYPEMAQAHHHEHNIQDLIQTVDVLFDVTHTRLSYVENDVKSLAKHTALLYKLILLLAKGLMLDNYEERKKIIEEAIGLLEEHIRQLYGENVG